MSFITDLIAKAKDMLEEEHKPPTATEAIERTSFDRRDWEIVKLLPAIEDELTEMDKTVDYAEDFMADLHAGFFKIDPRVRPAEEMKPSHAANRAVMDKMLEMPEVQALRQHSKGDAYGSAMAMGAMREVVRKTITEAQSAAREAAEREAQAKADAENAAQEMAELLAALQEQGEDGPDAQELGDELQAQMDQFAQNQLDMQQAAEDAGQQASATAEGMSNKLRSAAKKATQDADEEQMLMNSFGVDDGALQKMPVAERVALARRLRGSRLAQFAKLLGQFKAVQQAESRRRVTNAASEVHGITTGDDLHRMAMSETIAFADPTTETLLWQRWSEKQMLQYDVRGKEKLGQGPIICVVDESGSMGATDVAGGSREAWSKALSLALCDQARRRKRDFAYIGFSSAGQQHLVEFPKGEAPVERVVAMTEHFFNGGTHYEKPLLMALELAEKYEREGKSRPDIVFMTDDEYGQMDQKFMHRWNAVKDKTSLKCYGIAIGCGFSGTLQQVSDNVRAITQMVSDPRNVGDLFRTI